MNLADLKPGDYLDGESVLIEKRNEGTTKRGSPYLNLSVRDKTASLNAKIWDYNTITHGPMNVGNVVSIKATVDEYQGNNQLNITAVAESHADVSEFAKKTKFDVDEMWNGLVKIVGDFKEPLTKFVAEEILLKHGNVIEAFKKAPAARGVHNDWYGGLLEHVYSLCCLAEPIIRFYSERYYQIQKDKVYFGLIVHDVGKIVEYDFSNPAFQTTPIGVLTNHLVLGPAWVFEKANQYMDEFTTAHGTIDDFKKERAHLMHILAAHHGKYEWGSPVLPSSLEALIVHQLDYLDSKMMHAYGLIMDKEGSIPGFSERSYFEKAQYLR